MAHRRRRRAGARCWTGRCRGRVYALWCSSTPTTWTGSYVKAGSEEQLVGLCRERGVAIIADEVFYDYALEPFPGNARLAGEAGALTFALDGFSKMLAAPHAKVGWIQVSGPEWTFARPCRLDAASPTCR